MRLAHALLLIALVSAAMLQSAVHAQAIAGVDLVPAPFGYSYTFQRPVGQVHGIKTDTGEYIPVEADTSETGVLLYTVPYGTAVVTDSGTVRLRVVKRFEWFDAWGINLPGSDDIVIYGGGYVYLSSHDIYFDSVPQDKMNDTDVVVVEENSVDLRFRGIHVLSVTSRSISVIAEDGSVVQVELSQLVGAEGCIAWFENKPEDVPWVGGVIPTPTCLKNVKILKYYEYSGQSFGVVFSVKHPRIEFVVMAPPTAEILAEIGLLTPLASGDLHVVYTTLDDMYLYHALTPKNIPIKRSIVDAVDATIVTSDGRYICPLPLQFKEVYGVLWRSRQLRGNFELMPGEVLLFKSGGRYYVCHGALDWLKSSEVPSITGPAFREIRHPVVARMLSGAGKLLAVLSNGKVYYGTEVTIPYEECEKNKLWVISGDFVLEYVPTQSSILLSPFFAISLLIFGALVLYMLQRTPPAPKTVTIIWDLSAPSPPPVAEMSEVYRIASKNIENFGVCPEELDLAIRYKILPPLREKVDDPNEPVIYCPFRTNPETEVVLRRIVDVLLMGFWGVKRTGPSHGYIYTIFGGRLIYMYFYKQEHETRPEEILLNAIKKSRRTRIEMPYHKLPLGLLIVVKPEMVEEVKNELRYLKRFASAEEGKVDISQYLSVKFGNELDSKTIQKLQRFVDKEVPEILVVSTTNLTELIEFLSERFTAVAEEYRKLVREV